eukprot:16392498-Heterocapsa_arctica.AAC.1
MEAVRSASAPRVVQLRKLRTKYDRVAIALHVLNQVCTAWALASSHAGFDLEGDWGLEFVVPQDSLRTPGAQIEPGFAA